MVNQVKVTQAEEEQEQPYDTSNPEEVNKARKKSARTRSDRLQFVQAAMSVDQGRAWFYDLLNRCHVFRNPFISDSSHGTAFRCGEQNIGLMILADIQDAAPEHYMTMVSENKTKRNG